MAEYSRSEVVSQMVVERAEASKTVPESQRVISKAQDGVTGSAQSFHLFVTVNLETFPDNYRRNLSAQSSVCNLKSDRRMKIFNEAIG